MIKTVFTDNGTNAIRDLFATALTDAALGTSSTAETRADTALGAKVAATDLAVSNTTNDKQVNMDYNLSAALGNGTTFKEFGTFDTNDVMFSRQTFADLTKASTEQWQISVIYKFNN